MAEIAESKPANDQQRQSDNQDDDDGLEQPLKAIAELRETRRPFPGREKGTGAAAGP